MRAVQTVTCVLKKAKNTRLKPELRALPLDHFNAGLRRIETTSFPPIRVSPTVTPTKMNPSAPASFSSFCIVEVFFVASSLYSHCIGLASESRSRMTTTSLPPNVDEYTDCPLNSNPALPAC